MFGFEMIQKQNFLFIFFLIINFDKLFQVLGLFFEVCCVINVLVLVMEFYEMDRGVMEVLWKLFFV